MAKHLFTSESVSEGHPDKIADQISDAVLDAILEQDPKARVACETYVKTGMVLVGGEITTSAWVDIEEITRNTVREIGYVHSDMGFDANSCAVLSAIGKRRRRRAAARQGAEAPRDRRDCGRARELPDPDSLGPESVARHHADPVAARNGDREPRAFGGGAASRNRHRGRVRRSA